MYSFFTFSLHTYHLYFIFFLYTASMMTDPLKKVLLLLGIHQDDRNIPVEIPKEPDDLSVTGFQNMLRKSSCDD